jgi:hypothetical protein
MDARMTQIADALNAHDAAALRATFSARAIEQAPDFDGGIEYLFSLFPEGGVTWDFRNFGSQGGSSNGQSFEMLLAYYIVSAHGNDYTFFFADFTGQGVAGSDREGVYGMGATPLTDDPHTGPALLFFTWAGAMSVDESGEGAYAGVYVPVYDSVQLSDGMMSEIAWEVGTQDSVGLRQKFTDSAIAELGTVLDVGIQDVFALFPDRDVVWQELEGGPVVRKPPDGGDETILLLSTYRVSSSGSDFWFFFAYFPVNTLDAGNVGVYALGVAQRTEAGDSADEQALFAWADAFDISVSTPPGILIFR